MIKVKTTDMAKPSAVLVIILITYELRWRLDPSLPRLIA